jgi:hypothetical protein
LFFRKYEFHIGSIRAGEQLRMVSSVSFMPILVIFFSTCLRYICLHRW